jgi:hypothetical protein
MPRTLNDIAFAMLSDREWLYSKHCIDHFSINEISKELQCTPATIVKFLRFHEIASPPKQILREASNIRKYGVANTGSIQSVREKAAATMVDLYGGHNWSHSAGRGGRDFTCLLLYGDKNVAKTHRSKDKQRRTKLGDSVVELFTDPIWLKKSHYDENKSINQLCIEYNLSYSTVTGFFRDAGIDVRHTTIPVESEHRLLDKEWLLYQHQVLKKTMKDISIDLGVSVDTVSSYFKTHDITIILHSSKIPFTTRQLLADSSTIKHLYDTTASLSSLADQLEVSVGTVLSSMTKHDICHTKKHVKMNYRVYEKLNDPHWLRYEHNINKNHYYK